MVSLKCKMCGGSLTIEEGNSVCECEYCGSKQTIPSVDDEKKLTLYARANKLRASNEFDKAQTVYEQIITDFPEDAEAYWGMCLCKFGIEYIEDVDGSRKPTCHRTLPTSIFDDSDFEQVMENSDSVARPVYRAEAKEIERIQRRILEIAQNEEPYDVFICYKETDEAGGRTEDSVLAQDIYDTLNEKGLKVFFARITLESKLGSEYEPYIYAALSSAKVMLAIGTDYDYFNAVWVKNEWARFLSMMKSDRKKSLIPCYKGIDAYDLPREFKNLQAQDMAKLGWHQDLVRGVLKLCGKAESPATVSPVAANPTVDSYLERIKLFLEDGDWKNALKYCEKVLDIAPSNSSANIYKLLATMEVKTITELGSKSTRIDTDKLYSKAVRFAPEAEKKLLQTAAQTIIQRIEAADRVLWKKATEEAHLAAQLSRENAIKHANARRKKAKASHDFDMTSAILAKEKPFLESVAQKILGIVENPHKASVQSAEEQRHQAELDRLQAELVSINDECDRLIAEEERLKAERNNAEEAQYEQKSESLKRQISNLEQELSTLGIFSGRRKKEICELIDSLKVSKGNLSAQHRAETDKIQKLYLAECERILQEASGKAANIHLCIAEENNVFEENLKHLEENAGFGRFAKEENGTPQPIDWQILDIDVQKRAALIISKFCISYMPFDSTKRSGFNNDWEPSTIRQWLNKDFLSSSFTPEEQLLIKSVTIRTQAGNSFDKNRIKNTQDRFWLLSREEASTYFTSDSERQALPTRYVFEQSNYIDTRHCSYWLRSPVVSENEVDYVYNDGHISRMDLHPILGKYYSEAGVRPAFWLDLNASDFCTEINEQIYADALTYMASSQYFKALILFNSLNGFRDSSDKAMICQNNVYDNEYKKASELYNSGKYYAAYKAYSALRGFMDVDKLLSTNSNILAAIARNETLEQYRLVGNIVTYGHYEQDNDTSNGPEEIEWIVLDFDEKNNRALLLSRYGLDTRSYHNTVPRPSWEKSDVRAWLNSDFLNTAFSEQERLAIATIDLKYCDKGSKEEMTITDRIRLLTSSELNNYLKTEQERVTIPTAFAKAKGLKPVSSSLEVFGVQSCDWWLAATDISGKSAPYYNKGGFSFDKNAIDNSAVRPVFWLTLDKAFL